MWLKTIELIVLVSRANVDLKNWPRSWLIYNILIEFANFYQCFIQDFNQLAVSLISIFKITKSSNLASKVFGFNNNEIVNSGDIDSDRTNKPVRN